MSSLISSSVGEEQNMLLLLEVAGLQVQIAGRSVLEDLDFRLDRGQFCALIGENGAGKTTLLRAILGLQPVRQGSIRIQGKPASELRGQIGYVPQKIAFDPNLPLRTRDLVELGLKGNRFGFRGFFGNTRSAVAAALAAVDGEGFADQRIGRLSGGQQQRAVIAHALVRRPPLLLLDEPLANLDFRSTNTLVQMLGRLVREEKITVLVTAHDMNPLLPFLDRLIYLAHGRAAVGDVDTVVQDGVLSHLYGYPVTVLRHQGRILVLPEDPRQGMETACPAHREAEHGEPGP